MKKINSLLIVIVLLFSSCENSVNEGISKVPLIQTVVTTIDPVKEVNLDIINRVATSYGIDMQTRSVNTKQIKEIIPIKDSQGTVIIYIVNYKDNKGYIILSGDNDYQPVLAYNEMGNFNLEEAEHNGVSVWLHKQQNAIQNVKLLSDSIRLKNRMAWNKYSEKKVPLSLISKVKTRNSDSDLQYQVGVYIEETLNKWSDEGYTIYAYGDGSILEELFPSTDIPAIKEYLAINAEDRFFEGFNSTVFIRVKDSFTETESVGPLLKSTWAQSGDYAKYTPSNFPAGCVAVAIGQIMRYHEYPSFYNWNAMAYAYPTDITAQFLSDVGKKAKISYASDGSGTSIKNGCEALKKYGYSSSQVVEDKPLISILDQLRKHWPICMSGKNKSGKGHAWVCDGFSSAFYHNPYEVMAIDKTVFDKEGYPEYRCMHSQNVVTGWILYHMNWGWGGNYDGNYGDTDNLSEEVKYVENRKSIINIHP